MRQTISLLLTGVSLVASAAALNAASRPNILYLYADDWGWGAIGPNGQAERKAKGLPYVKTPNLDRLAAQGVNFTRAYGCTVCSPARSSQQTGFHQGHTFADRNDPDNAKKAMREEDQTMGDLLSQAGYVTGYWGKWGYGGSKDRERPELLNVQTLPTSHGYQHVVAELHHVRAHTFFQPSLWTAPAALGSIGGIALSPNSVLPFKGNALFPDQPAWQNHPDYPTPAYCDDVYAFSALEFVRREARRYRATGQPFFGLFAAQIPHAPFAEISQLPEWDHAYREDAFFESLSPQAQQWAAMVTRLDAHFGNLLDALEDPNGDGDSSDSVVDDTLVIFQSDNGGPQHPARESFAANGGLRGRKGQIYEGGIRVPTIVRWPSKITASSKLRQGSNSDRLVGVTDWLPTFCELAGVPSPLGIDGVSLAPTLLGHGFQRQRDFLIHEAGKAQSVIRGEYKLVRSPDGLALFHLEDDPNETTDIAEENARLVSGLNKVLIGERATEPKGFAATYHHWTGLSNGVTSNEQNWSDYVYANAGVTYQQDSGAPQWSWIARIEANGQSPIQSRVDGNLNVLALGIGGADELERRVTVTVPLRSRLVGRNEVRVRRGGTIHLDGGVVESLRWVDIEPEAVVTGWGMILTSVFNEGTIHVGGKPANGNDVRILEQVRLAPSSVIRLHLDPQFDGKIETRDEVNLDGFLELDLVSGFELPQEESRTVILTRKVNGRFRNPDDKLIADDGTQFQIVYSATRVELKALPNKEG